ncbi:thioredoxin family protein [Aquimarina sp. 2201CG1-2-11]|uniref:thioredoxin family protein n=1 Tax=Aquimarina discodermiae TaxID=3231043 RepID=UPI00346274FE
MKAIHLCTILLLFAVNQNAVSQLQMSSFETLEEKMKTIAKPIVVFIHTDWCVYCKNMKNTTFNDPEVIEKLNNDFYFISFNAESLESIDFLNHTFHFESNGHRTGIHSLAKELATVNNKIAYPTTTILNQDYEVIFQYQSFLSAKDLNIILEKISHNNEKHTTNLHSTF